MGKNPTLYGLKRSSKFSIEYDIEKKKIVNVKGNDQHQFPITISDDLAFSQPLFIAVNGIPLFPSKYEIINSGSLVYSSPLPPINDFELIDSNLFNEGVKRKQNTIGINDLILYNISGRKRSIFQNKVMGESANVHAQKLIDQGILKPENNSQMNWHWCHLVAFSMLHEEKAQRKNNLVCGTAACNGHMANIEAAVKEFIYNYKRLLGLEVTATTYANTSLALRIRYRIYDKKGSRLVHTEYFDPLSLLKSDIQDCIGIYQRLLKSFDIK